MPKLSCLIHAINDGPRIGQTLESVALCDEVLVVDHGSSDNTDDVVRHYGAVLKVGIPGVDYGVYARETKHDWILCLKSNEILDEKLQTALKQWKDLDLPDEIGFSIGISEQNGSGWTPQNAETRLVNKRLLNWTGELPPGDLETEGLEGQIMRSAK